MDLTGTMQDEKVLWADFQQGDAKACESLFLRYHPALFSYGSKIIRDRHLLDDCIQELFLELWQRRERLPDVTSFKAYLFKSLKFKLIQAYKRESKQAPLSHDGHEGWEFSYETILIEEQANLELKEKLLLNIRQLTQRQQEVLYLRFYNQMSYEEISDVMSISYQAVVNLVYKSIKFLRENFFLMALLLVLDQQG